MVHPNRFVFVLLVSCGTTSPAVSFAADLFTVADSIELTRIVDPAKSSLYGSIEEIKRSPDGKHFFIITRRGNLSADTLQYELILFDVEDVLAFVADDNPTELAPPNVLVSFESSPIGGGARSGGIGQARWLPDSRRIAFVGERLSGHAQVYSVDIQTGRLRSLTAHSTPVQRFSLSSHAERLVYVAGNNLPDWDERNRRGYAVAPDNVRHFYKLFPNRINTFVGESLYIQDYSEHASAPTKIAAVSGRLDLHGGIWLSPSGRWAVALAYAPDVPVGWLSEYETLKQIGSAQKQAAGNPAFPADRSLARRFVLIDTSDGTVSDLLRSPVSWGGHDVHWSRDERHVILANTHLPLDDGIDQETLDLRRTTASVIEVELTTRAITPIDHFAVHSGGGQIDRTDRTKDGRIVVKYRQPGDDTTRIASYLKTSTGDWLDDELTEKSEQNQRLFVSVTQDMNSPPDLLATDLVTNRSRAITKLNPQLDKRLLGRVEKIEWTDANERTWQGGLMYPPTHDPTRRYPLVIQTYGFSEDEYVVDGPHDITSAFAARSLASQDIIVLQMGLRPKDGRFALGGPLEGPNYVAGFEGAVHALDELEIIDPERVGLIGFSRTGFHVSYAVTFSKIRFAAATIADSASAGYLTHIYSYGFPYPGMIADEMQIGAPFSGEDRETWLENSPNFNAYRVDTPLRFEHYGVKINLYWDMFALLARNRRPVEMIHIPYAHHVLKRPQARYTSQQGNVDWFAFWLTGYEDPDPSKSEQYKRWRELRLQQEALRVESKEAAASQSQGR